VSKGIPAWVIDLWQIQAARREAKRLARNSKAKAARRVRLTTTKDTPHEAR